MRALNLDARVEVCLTEVGRAWLADHEVQELSIPAEPVEVGPDGKVTMTLRELMYVFGEWIGAGEPVFDGPVMVEG